MFRRVLLTIRRSSLSSRRGSSSARTPCEDAIRGVRSLLAAGAGGELAVHAYLLVAHYVIGTALLDTVVLPAPDGSARP